MGLIPYFTGRAFQHDAAAWYFAHNLALQSPTSRGGRCNLGFDTHRGER
ncbi:MAG TPA: hypothetical protein VG452_09100 [Egibacteraceae bacterium]|nr:hypothetical protein [Egibacteraceae bacterium]